MSLCDKTDKQLQKLIGRAYKRGKRAGRFEACCYFIKRTLQQFRVHRRLEARSHAERH